MKLALYTLLCVITLWSFGCHPKDKGVILQEGVGSDTATNNIVTRPVLYAFSAIVGEGLEVKQAVTSVNKDGFMELEVRGFNKSFLTRQFEYKVEWLDASGMVIDSTANKWLLSSAAGKSPFTLKAVAPRTTAVDFRMNTRKIANP